MKLRGKHFLWVLPLTVLIVSSCAQSGTGPEVVETGSGDEDNRTFIKDRTGKLWDVTYAVEQLGFRTGDFNYGLGPNAILPIIDPELLVPGDDDYPTPERLFRVLGMTAGDEHRAYSVSEIAGHEVVNDRVGKVAFAATY